MIPTEKAQRAYTRFREPQPHYVLFVATKSRDGRRFTAKTHGPDADRLAGAARAAVNNGAPCALVLQVVYTAEPEP